MSAYNFLTQPNAYNALQTLEVGQKAKQNRLADMSRQYAGAAIGGDENALAKLGGVNPELALNVKQENRLTSADQRQQQLQKLQEVASIYTAADTPEKFGQAVNLLRQQGYNLDPEEADFNNRELVIAKATSLKDHIAAGQDAKKFAFDQQRYAQTQANVDRSFGATQDYRAKTLALQEAKVTGGANKPMTASMLKLKRETENAVVDLQNTVAVLERAKELVPSAFEGLTAGTRAYIGSRASGVPGVGMIADKAGSDATTELGNIMSMEAIQSMSNSLKGATTDFELRKFEQILSDPTVPAAIKTKTIDRMLALAQNKMELEQQRLGEFGGTVPERGGTQPGPTDGGGQIFNEAGSIPEGAIVEDDENPGVYLQKVNGTLVPVE